MSMEITHLCGIICNKIDYKAIIKLVNIKVIWYIERKKVDIKVIYDGGFMSGDAGLNEPVVFYSKKMTETKIVLLSLKGIKFAEDCNGKRRTNTDKR